jgi:Rrf2 family protein
MQILAIEEYGLRCLLQVAFHEPPRPITGSAIARTEGLSVEYVAKLMQKLRLGGLVTSARGARGGYRLTRRANEISVWEAITVLGGEFLPDGFCDCHPGQRRDCVRVGDCSIRALWHGVEGTLRAALEKVSLADLRRDEATMATWLASRAVSPLANA